MFFIHSIIYIVLILNIDCKYNSIYIDNNYNIYNFDFVDNYTRLNVYNNTIYYIGYALHQDLQCILPINGTSIYKIKPYYIEKLLRYKDTMVYNKYHMYKNRMKTFDENILFCYINNDNIYFQTALKTYVYDTKKLEITLIDNCGFEKIFGYSFENHINRILYIYNNEYIYFIHYYNEVYIIKAMYNILRKSFSNIPNLFDKEYMSQIHYIYDLYPITNIRCYLESTMIIEDDSLETEISIDDTVISKTCNETNNNTLLGISYFLNAILICINMVIIVLYSKKYRKNKKRKGHYVVTHKVDPELNYDNEISTLA